VLSGATSEAGLTAPGGRSGPFGGTGPTLAATGSMGPILRWDGSAWQIFPSQCIESHGWEGSDGAASLSGACAVRPSLLRRVPPAGPTRRVASGPFALGPSRMRPTLHHPLGCISRSAQCSGGSHCACLKCAGLKCAWPHCVPSPLDGPGCDAPFCAPSPCALSLCAPSLCNASHALRPIRVGTRERMCKNLVLYPRVCDAGFQVLHPNH
jgi:hypothetical protein